MTQATKWLKYFLFVHLCQGREVQAVKSVKISSTDLESRFWKINLSGFHLINTYRLSGEVKLHVTFPINWSFLRVWTIKSCVHQTHFKLLNLRFIRKRLKHRNWDKLPITIPKVLNSRFIVKRLNTDIEILPSPFGFLAAVYGQSRHKLLVSCSFLFNITCN